MKNMLRNIFIIIVILIFIFAFNPSYVSLSMDNLAYVIAIGIDKGENEKYKFTFQFTKGASGESSSSENSPSIINSVEASSLDVALNLLNAYVSKESNLAHCKIVVFSEPVAVEGISDHIYTLINNVQMRPSTNIIISKNDAISYIENANPVLENLITKYYDIFPNSSKYTGYVVNVTLGDFFNGLTCDTCEPFAILGGVNVSSIPDTASDFSIKSTQTPFFGEQSAENLGVAVFKEDKLIGELTAIETLCLSLIRSNQLNSFLITSPDPEEQSSKIDISINTFSIKPKVEILNGTPYITITGKVEGNIDSMENHRNYLDSSVLEALSDSVSLYLENLLTNYLYKTSTVYQSDINGFGKYAASCFLTSSEFEAYDWPNSYANATFKVTIDSNIEMGALLTNT